MRIVWAESTFGALAIGLLLIGCARAQDDRICSPGMRADGSYGVNFKADSPFSATAKLTFEQQLPNGNRIRGFARFHQARSSAGSTRNEVPQRCFPDEEGEWKLAYSINTFDATTKVSEYWNLYGDMVGWREGVVSVGHPTTVTDLPTMAQMQAHDIRNRSLQKWNTPSFKTENLGTKTILGVSVVGKRMTTTIAEGKEGNELALEITHEDWWSEALGQSLLVIDDDPRIGRTTYEIETITFSEPDRAQFLPPAGYIRRDVQAQ